MNHALAVDHLTDWSLTEWWLHYLGAIAVPMIATVLVVAGYLLWQVTVRLDLPNLLEAALGVVLTACAFAAVFFGLHWHIELLYGTLRHTSSATRAVLAALVVAALLAATSVAVAVKVGIHRRRWLAVIALACAVPSVFNVVGDGLNRAPTLTAHDTASAGQQMPAVRNALIERSSLSRAPMNVLPRSPPAGQPGVHINGPQNTSPLKLSLQQGDLSCPLLPSARTAPLP